MNQEITRYYSDFKEYYQGTSIRRFVIGLIVGILFTSLFFVISNLLRVISEDVLWNTILNDLPVIGGILGLAITLQMWGLLPQPLIKEKKQISETSTENHDKRSDEREIDELESSKS